MAAKLKKGDTVMVIAGKDKGEAQNEEVPEDVRTLLP